MCQSTVDYDALLARVQAAQPTRCPRQECGSTRILPLFLDEQDRSWECLTCLAVFEGAMP